MRLITAGWSIAAALVGIDNACAQVEYVDPTIGGIGYLLEPTRPTVSLPNSMVRLYPVRKDATDDRIHSFPLTVISHRLGELFWLMPCSGLRSEATARPAGAPEEDAWDRPAAYDQEKTTPYYYSVRFDDSNLRTEFTPTERCGCFRFTFPSGKPVVLLANRLSGEMQIETNNAISGVERFQGMAAYLYGEFSAPVSVQSSRAGDRGRLTVGLANLQPSSFSSQLEFRYGISFISIAQARRNLHEEIPHWDFDKIRDHARQRWNDVLGQIEVAGGTLAQKRVFYTALYRCYERMICITEDGRYYSAFDHRVHTDARPFYVDNWIWDLYQAQLPLMEILNPDLSADEISSYVRMYEQDGWMPSFAVLWGDYPCMTGNHAAAWMADAWFKGIRHFDLKTAYAGLRKNSLDATLLPWRNGPRTSLDDFYDEHGYLPALDPGEKETVAEVNSNELRQAVSVTLANSYDDWCIAQLAGVLGNAADHDLFLKRAAYYKNVFRVDKGRMWPRDAAGNWVEPYDPKFPTGRGGRDYFTENNGYTYDWDVKQDLQGLFALMGGTQSAETKLDQLFREDIGLPRYKFYALYPDSTGMVGEFSMGNEPSFLIPYLYDYLGAPWKTQKRVRMLLDTWFTDTLLGMPGDEDGGGMSSWVVFGMLGFYPGVPGVPAYCLGSPVFDRVTIHLKNGKTLRIIARNNSADNKYIQNFRLDGRPDRRVWFRHADIADGGTLEMKMGNLPNKTLGGNPADFPPSEMALNPAALAK
ncbi:MAG TPA: GH92 family glycosyl hydrolase [Candidatus Sulfopaludibacter sp.]|nr:GH92 family glycosyl hydrolase [Candidatus Sulfopaludibacter sp.]